MKEIITGIFAAYIITAVVTNGNVLHSARESIKKKTPGLVKGDPGRHLVDCRMCMGAYVSMAVAVASEPSIVREPKSFLKKWLMIYAGSYFMATQER